MSPSWKVEARRRFGVHGDNSDTSREECEPVKLSVLRSPELKRKGKFEVCIGSVFVFPVTICYC